ncbi:hypothetical protein SESBI_04017 [Sesbania bispinosa]|nr:hypothetical protein SESBI_04017 [Sesbania bispinosa]
MANPLLRNFLLHRLRLHNYQRFIAGAVVAPHRHRLWCSTTASSSPSEQENEKTSSATHAHYSNPALCKDLRLDAPDFQWKDEQEEILSDIESTVMLAKCTRIGSVLSDEDEKAVVEKLLVYHPDYEDKIGCGLESITVSG